MSFDLYILDMDATPDEETLVELLEDDTGWDEPLTQRLAAFVAEMESRYPWADDNPDSSPWASWPLTQSMARGRCCAFNITWSAADTMAPALIEAASTYDLVVYDPQASEIIRPDAVRAAPAGRTSLGGRLRRWLGRR